MIRFRSGLAWLLTLLCTLSLTGCHSVGETDTVQFFAMDTVMSLTATGEDVQPVLNAARTRVEQLERLLSVTDANSELTAINTAEGQSTAVSADTAAVLATALHMAEQTAGAFDPTLYPLTKAWGFLDGEYRVPTTDELTALLPQTGWERVSLIGTAVTDNVTPTVTVPAGFGLNLGGIAKGYAAQQVTDLFADAGITSAMVDLGGNIQVLGGKPDGSDWVIGIRDPRQENGLVGAVCLQDGAVVTSGVYQRFFEQDGVRYHHILDPATGAPSASNLLSATVVCVGADALDGASADALATALVVMGERQALDYCRSHDNAEAVLVTADGRVVVTSGLQGVFDFSYCTSKDYTLEQH